MLGKEYENRIIKALATIDKENHYILLPWFYDYRPSTIAEATRIEQRNFDTRVIKKRDMDESVIRELDIIHSNNYRFPGKNSAKKIVTIYDVCFLDHPEYTTEANRLFCYRGTLDSMVFADKIIAISNYTKNRLLHYFPFVDEKKIEVVYCGNRNTLINLQNNIELINKFELEDGEYFLSVGTIEPRKNYKTLLQAYKKYKNSSRNYKKLCIAGAYGWMEESFQKNIKDLELEDDVVVTGYVSDEVLSNLYRHCFSFIYPTWYEGFGMPVLEAMNFGKAVITSNVSSIPEVVGDSALLTKPGDVDCIYKNMLSLEKSTYLYSELMEKMRVQVQSFSWEKSAEQVKHIYASVMYDCL